MVLAVFLEHSRLNSSIRNTSNLPEAGQDENLEQTGTSGPQLRNTNRQPLKRDAQNDPHRDQ